MNCLTKMVSSLRGTYGVFGCRNLATTTALQDDHSCKLLVVGGGCGGCATAAKFTRALGKKRVIVVDPAEMHYYQPMFTLIGGGMKTLMDAGRSMSSVLPKDATWIKDEVVEFEPKENTVHTKKGHTINYEFMVVAVGLVLHYEEIPGALEGLQMPGSGVCSIYSPKYVNRTFEALQEFEQGNAVFTFPNTPVKCAGAPQKIAYISEEFFQENGMRDDANVIYNTSLGVLFTAKKYADALWKVVEDRDIKVNLRTNLIEVRPDRKEAVFQNLDKPEDKRIIEYSMLHVTPPQRAPDVLRQNKDLSGESGFLELNPQTLQHIRYPNIFGIGDCTNLPTSKTAAAAAAQSEVLHHNLTAIMSEKPSPDMKYDGYTSCPLVTGRNKCILAEFGYDLQPLETFPMDQAVERHSMFLMKAHLMPELYWHAMLKGFWQGPRLMRKLMHLGIGK